MKTTRRQFAATLFAGGVSLFLPKTFTPPRLVRPRPACVLGPYQTVLRLSDGHLIAAIPDQDRVINGYTGMQLGWTDPLPIGILPPIESGEVAPAPGCRTVLMGAPMHPALREVAISTHDLLRTTELLKRWVFSKATPYSKFV